MSGWTPCKRREFIRRLRDLGFDGPYSGTQHQFIIYRHYRLAIPSNLEYSIPQNWVESYARNHGIPLEWAEKRVRKEDHVRPYLKSVS